MEILNEYIIQVIYGFDVLCNIIFFIWTYLIATDWKGLIYNYIREIKVVFWRIYLIGLLGVLFIPSKEILEKIFI